MANIVSVEWLTYRRVDTQEWLCLGELDTATSLKPLRVRTIEFPEVLPRLLLGVINLRSVHREIVQIEVNIFYLLMRERTMRGVARTVPRYHALHSLIVKGKQALEVPIALDADENYFSRIYPELVLKSVVLKARLVQPTRSSWHKAQADYLYTPWGD